MLSDYRNQRSVNFGVEIRPEKVHVECNNLVQVRAAIDAHGGVIRIFDRIKGEIVFEGTAEAFRKTQWLNRTEQSECLQHSMAGC